MKLHNNLKFACLLMAAFMLTFAACKKSSTTSNSSTLSSDDNGGYASDHASLESNGNNVMSIADNAAANGNNNYLRVTSTYPHVHNDTTVNPHVLTIDYGTTPTLSTYDGKYRSGEIMVTYGGHYKDSGNTRQISTINYMVGSSTTTMHQVCIHRSVTNMGTNTSGNDYYTIIAKDSIYYTADSVIYWTANRVRTWTSGYGTPTPWDDVYTISGSDTLVRANGHVFNFNIESTSPLVVAVVCPWIEAGKLDISGTTLSGTRVINYGDVAVCDPNATVTIGGVTYPIILR